MWVEAADCDHGDSVVAVREAVREMDRWPSISRIAFSPDNQRLLVAVHWKVEVLDVLTGATLRVFQGGRKLRFSSDGKNGILAS